MRNTIIGLLLAGVGVFFAISTNMSADETAEPSLIHVTKTGQAAARTVVLIPGLASSAEVWDETRAALEGGYDLRIIQVAGFAGAAPVEVEGNYTDAIAAAILEELRDRPGKDTVLLGHSLGGFVAMKTALSGPDLIDELVIVDSVPFLAGLFNPGATPELAAAQGPAMAAQMAAMPREAFDAQQKFGLSRLVKTQDYLPTLEAWGKASDQATVAKAMGELIAADLRADLSALSQDTFVMMPWDAAMGIPETQVRDIYEAQYAAAPNTRVETIKDSFHFIMVDQKEAFLESLTSALED